MRGVPGPHLGIGEEVGGGRRPRVASDGQIHVLSKR